MSIFSLSRYVGSGFRLQEIVKDVLIIFRREESG